MINKSRLNELDFLGELLTEFCFLYEKPFAELKKDHPSGFNNKRDQVFYILRTRNKIEIPGSFYDLIYGN